jgi:hypothetical protein
MKSGKLVQWVKWEKERRTSDDGATDTGSILSVVSLDLVALLAKDFDESLVNALGELGVLVVERTWTKTITSQRKGRTYQLPAIYIWRDWWTRGEWRNGTRTVSSDIATLLHVALLGDDSGDTAGGETGGTSTDELGKGLEKVSLLLRGLESEEVGEDANDHETFIGLIAVRAQTQSKAMVRVRWTRTGSGSRGKRQREGYMRYSRLDEGKESGVESVRLLDLVGDLTKEELALVDELAQDQTEDLSEVESGDHLLERLKKPKGRRLRRSQIQMVKV